MHALTKAEFQHLMTVAESFKSLVEAPDVYFWEGYIRGLRRRYYGTNFGTAEEHEKWYNLEGPDPSRRFRGVGYRSALEGEDVKGALRFLEALAK